MWLPSLVLSMFHDDLGQNPSQPPSREMETCSPIPLWIELSLKKGLATVSKSVKLLDGQCAFFYGRSIEVHRLWIYIFLANQRLLKNKADKIQVKEKGNVEKDHVPHALAVVSNNCKLCNHSLHWWKKINYGGIHYLNVITAGTTADVT